MSSSPPPARKRFRLYRFILSALILALWTYGGGWIRVWLDEPRSSVSHGSPARGSIDQGHPLPPSGPGFRTYSYLGATLGRQYVHEAVRDLLVEVFGELHREHPQPSFIVGETGWPTGGPFWPHRTHQNGLSVDLFVPIVDEATGTRQALQCWPWNRFCYGYELDSRGRLGTQRLDFEALAELLGRLEARSNAHGLEIAKLIIAPEYIEPLLDTPSGRRLHDARRRVVRTPVWIRHDDHVHLDFSLVGPP